MENTTWNKVLAVQVSELLAAEGAPSKTVGDFAKDAKAILFVNTACFWGLTKTNYEQLVPIYKDLHP